MVVKKVEVQLANRSEDMGDADTEPLLATDALGIDTDELDDSPVYSEVRRDRPASNVSSLTGSDNMDAEVARIRDDSISVTKRNILSILVLTLVNLLNYMDRSSVAGIEWFLICFGFLQGRGGLLMI